MAEATARETMPVPTTNADLIKQPTVPPKQTLVVGTWPYSESQDQQQVDSEMGASMESRVKYINTNGQKLIQKFQIAD